MELYLLLCCVLNAVTTSSYNILLWLIDSCNTPPRYSLDRDVVYAVTRLHRPIEIVSLYLQILSSHMHWNGQA